MADLAGFRRDSGYERRLKWTDWPLVGLGLLFLVVLILPLAEPLTPTAATVLNVANVVIWALFTVDYVARVYLSPDRRQFVRTHLLDLVVVVVPFLRPFRLLRLVAIVVSTSRRAGGLAVRKVTLYVIGLTVIVMSVGAVVVFDAEKATPTDERTINTLGDALWWALVTVTTVGYGDVFPRSTTGRLFAGLLMVAGIALIGTVTAAVASWFVNIVRTSSTTGPEQEASDERESLRAEVQALTVVVEELRSEVRAHRSMGVGASLRQSSEAACRPRLTASTVTGHPAVVRASQGGLMAPIRALVAMALAVVLSLAGLAIAGPASAHTKPKHYKNCTAMHKKYPGGVAKTKKAKNTQTVNGKKVLADSQYKPKVSKKLYRANKGLDRDKDHIACEA